jgi:anti-sigma regulatory factor (Ser/Thr protein kinase)
MDTMVVRIADPSGAGEARRRALDVTARLGFAEAAASGVAISVMEMATNLLKHAKEGILLVQPVDDYGRRGLDLVGIDRGPGMANVATAMRDGYSTAGSAGTGLGALSRLADSFDVHSTPGGGTVVAARFWAQPGKIAARAAAIDIAGFSVALAGELASGDAWDWHDRPGGARIVLVDGLGHGVGAATAAQRALELAGDASTLAPVALLERLHAGLRDTRGAAGAVADIDLNRGSLSWAGVGNIAGVVVTATGSRNMVSTNGTLGHEARRITAFDYPFPRGAVLVLHSDGLSSRWSLDAYPGLLARRPAMLGAVLFRDFGRPRDDATVVVARAREGAPA